MIVDEEDTLRPGPCRSGAGSRLLPCRRLNRLQAHAELGSAVRTWADSFDRAAMELHELANERQTDTQPAFGAIA